MALFDFNTTQFMAFVLILTRVSIILALVPILGGRLVPAQIKIALIMALSFFLWTAIQVDPSVFPEDITAFAPLVAAEAILGIGLALLIRMIFASVELAGQLIGYQMGMAIANVMDPQTGAQSSIIAEFSYILALFLFISMNGHYLIIKGLTESFEVISPGRLYLHSSALELMMNSAARMFIVAVKIGAAPFVVLFFTKISMGIVAKTVPQMNVLFVGMPLYIVIGLLTFGLSLKFFGSLLGQSFSDLEATIPALFKALAR